jgi:HK97 family phage prohead protease
MQDGEIPVCWQHDLRTPIGVGKLIDMPHKGGDGKLHGGGLKIEGELYLDTAMGRQAYELMKPREGFKRAPVRGLSIGYETVKWDMIKDERHIREIKLYEVSAVTIGANQRAVINTVKGCEPTAEIAALANIVGQVVQEIQNMKASLADFGLVDDPHLLQSLKAMQEAIPGVKFGDPPYGDSEQDPNAVDGQSLEQLRDWISEFKRVLTNGGSGQQDGNAGGHQVEH